MNKTGGLTSKALDREKKLLSVFSASIDDERGKRERKERRRIRKKKKNTLEIKTHDPLWFRKA